MARETLIADAKAARARAGARRLPPSPAAPHPRHRRGGRGDAARRAASTWTGRTRSPTHDATIGGHLARVLSGGAVPAGAAVSEQHILDLEREAFLSLCGEPKTRDRIQHMLQKSKPLRN